MASSGLRAGLLKEILTMAVDTLRANKLRSALTILGVVIGITSIVSMTALIRGFDESFKDLFRQIGPNTIFVAKFSFVSFSQGKEFRDLIKRPNITIEDAHAIERSPLVDIGRRCSSAAARARSRERFTYGNNATKRMAVIGASANFGETNSIPLEAGRVFTADRGRPAPQRRRAGQRAGQGAVPRPPIRSASRCASAGRSTRWSACSASGRTRSAAAQADEFAIIPHTT